MFFDKKLIDMLPSLKGGYINTGEGMSIWFLEDSKTPMVGILSDNGRTNLRRRTIYFDFEEKEYALELGDLFGADVYAAIRLTEVKDLWVFKCNYSNCNYEIRNRGKYCTVAQGGSYKFACGVSSCNNNPNGIRVFIPKYKLIISEHFLGRGKVKIERMLQTHDVIARTCVALLDIHYPDLSKKYVDQTRSTGGDSSYLINSRTKVVIS